MNVSDMILELDDHGFGDTSTVRKGQMLNETYADLCGREGWPFLEKMVTNLTPTGGAVDTFSNQPTDLREVKMLINSATGFVLQPERADVVLKRNAATLTLAGDPVWYYFIGGVIHLFPIPGSTAGPFWMIYLARANTLTVSGTNANSYTGSSVEATVLLPPDHHRLLVAGTLAKLYNMEDDNDLSPGYQAEFEAGIATMKDELFRRTQADRPDRIYAIDESFEEFGDY